MNYRERFQEKILMRRFGWRYAEPSTDKEQYNWLKFKFYSTQKELSEYLKRHNKLLEKIKDQTYELLKKQKLNQKGESNGV